MPFTDSTVFDTLREPLLILDKNLHVLLANRAFYKFFRVQPNEVEGCLLYALGNGQWNIPQLKNLLEDILPYHTTIEDYQVDYQFPKIGRKVIALNARKIFREENQSETILLALEDVTEKKRLENVIRIEMEELKQVNFELNKFSSTVAHDLKAPLREIRMFAELLNSNYEMDNANKVDFLSRIMTATKRMHRLINDLLDYALSTQPREFRKLDLGNLMKQILADLQVFITGKNAKIEVDPLPVVNCNPFQMRQLFQNLIDNAIKYGAKPGDEPKIKIYCKQAEQELEILIRDNGPGIQEEYQARIFEPFQRLDSTKSGTGLGLAICKKVAEQHGSKLSIDSEPDKGSAFIIKVPSQSVIS